MRRRLAMALLAVAVLAGGGAVALAGATRGVGAVPMRTGGLATARFAVGADAVSAPKQDVVAQATTAYRWVWQSDGPQRTLALFSCDLDAPHVDGHSVDNWIVTATRVS